MNVAVKTADKPKVEHKTPQVIKKVGVIGAGQMGTGIAHVIALGGYSVALNDLKKETVESRWRTIERNMRRQAEKGIITEGDVKPALKRISYAPSFDAFADCDLVIEAATEDEARQAQDLHRALPEAQRPRDAGDQHVVDLDHAACFDHRPARALHRHALHEPGAADGAGRADPRHRHRRRHVRAARAGSSRASARSVAVSEDFPAFIVNRILLPMINEAVYTLYEGVGTVEAIDKAMRLGAHHPMGPLELADFIGLDTCLSVMQVLYEGLSDSKYRPCPLLVKYVEAGWLGRKTQRGFYDYRGEKPVPTR